MEDRQRVLNAPYTKGQVVVEWTFSRQSLTYSTPSAMTDQFCELIKASLGISKDRICIGFDDVNSSDFGWNGRTFG